MKLNKKVLGMLMSGALVFGMVGCSSDESNEGYQPKQETKQEQQYEEQEQQEQQYEEPKDESLNEEYNDYSQSKAQQVKEVMTAVCEETFSSKIDWEVIERDGIVYVNFYIPYNELANTSVQSWNELVNVMQEKNNLFYNELVEYGYDVPLVFTIGSRETNEHYYIVMNGQVMFDAVNGINKLN